MGSNNSKISYMDQLISVIEDDNVYRFTHFYNKSLIPYDYIVNIQNLGIYYEVKFGGNYNEAVCLLCKIHQSQKIYDYITKIFEIDYKTLFYMLIRNKQSVTFNQDGSLMKDENYTDEIFRDIFMKVKDNICLNEDIIKFLIVHETDYITEFFKSYKDKSIFNRMLENRNEYYIIKSLINYVDDEELIDNCILSFYIQGIKLGEDYTLDCLANPNRKFRLKCVSFNIYDNTDDSISNQDFNNAKICLELMIIISKHGLLLTMLLNSIVVDKNIIRILINKGLNLNVIKIDEDNFTYLNIEKLKLIEDMENFDDFLSLNRRLFLSKAKTDEEVDYITSRI